MSESVLPESQCGFRAGRSTSGMIFTLHQLQEKAIEQQQPLYIVFIDFSKAFDIFHQTPLWEVLTTFSVCHGVKQNVCWHLLCLQSYLAAVLEYVGSRTTEDVDIRT